MLNRTKISLALCILSLSSGLSAHAQTMEQALNQAISISNEASQHFVREIQLIKDKHQLLTNISAMQGCECYPGLGNCFPSVSLTPTNDRSIYRVTFPPEFNFCVQVSSYITTQWDIDNNTPITESITVFKGPDHEEFVDNSSWNGRQPILDGPSSCVICEDAQTKYCAESEGLVDKYQVAIGGSRDAASQTSAGIQLMESTGMATQLVNTLVTQRQLMLEFADVAEELVNSVHRKRAEWCN